MGLFDRLKKKTDGKQNLAEYSGMRVEVMDETGRLLFLARCNTLWDGTLELESITGSDFIEAFDQMDVTLRGYEESVQKAVHMRGELTRLDDKWRVSNLRVTGKDNDREYFRQEAIADGSVASLQQKGVASDPCRLLNISVGGICIFTEGEFRRGERLLVHTQPFEGLQLAPMICAVRRVTRRKNGFEYGCEFEDLSPSAESAIAKAITEMQLKRIRRS